MRPIRARQARRGNVRYCTARAPSWPNTWHNESRCMRLALKDWTGMLDALHTRKRGHAVPPWSSPRATWLATRFPCEPVEPSNQVRRELLRMCQLLRKTQSSCLAHCVSATCLIDKKNLAHSTRRFRRLEICDMIGGAHATALWKKRGRQQDASQYGYCVLRHHLQAVLAIRLQLWSLRAGTSWGSCSLGRH